MDTRPEPLSVNEDTALLDGFLATRKPELREALILRYVPLVHFVLGRLGFSQDMGADYEDAASQGLLGLIEAVDRFDPGFGAQFSTYAILRVRGKVLDHLRAQDWLSRGARQRAQAVQRAITELWGVLQRAPSDQELAERLRYDPAQLHQALQDGSRMMISLDILADADGDATGALYDVLPDETQPDPSAVFEAQEQKERLAIALRSLSEREQMVLGLYYHEELTFKEIGQVLSISESRVCQLHGRAVMSLRAALKQLDPQPFLAAGIKRRA